MNTPWYDLHRPDHARRAISDDYSDAGHCRQPGQKKYVPPSLDTFPVTTPLFTTLLIGDSDCGSADFLPTDLGTDPGAPAHGAGKTIFKDSLWRRRAERFGNGRLSGARFGMRSQVQSAQDDGQSCHVRRRNRECDYYVRCFSKVALPSNSTCKSRFGFGSRCCSRISPKPWRKAGARRRRNFA